MGLLKAFLAPLGCATNLYSLGEQPSLTCCWSCRLVHGIIFIEKLRTTLCHVSRIFVLVFYVYFFHKTSFSVSSFSQRASPSSLSGDSRIPACWCGGALYDYKHTPYYPLSVGILRQSGQHSCVKLTKLFSRYFYPCNSFFEPSLCFSCGYHTELYVISLIGMFKCL